MWCAKRTYNCFTKKIVLIAKAIVIDNHNYCPANFIDQDGPNELVPGEWRKDSDDITGLVNIRRAGSNDHPRDACQIRNKFKEYFSTKGAVD